MDILIFQNLKDQFFLRPNLACFIMCRDLRVRVLHALNGCPIEQQICIQFFCTDLQRIPCQLHCRCIHCHGKAVRSLLKILNSYFQVLAGMHLFGSKMQGLTQIWSLCCFIMFLLCSTLFTCSKARGWWDRLSDRLCLLSDGVPWSN